MDTIHFHSSDGRFCGAIDRPRQFSTDDNKITCQQCLARDTVDLTEQGREYLKSVGLL